MKQWMLLRDQGGGCDYTIGCGVAYETFEAPDKEAAIKVAKGKLTEHGHFGTGDFSDEWRLNEALLVEMTSAEWLPIDDWLTEQTDAAEAEVKRKKEAQERADYERLQKKFGT